jgi:hypothetical protein
MFVIFSIDVSPFPLSPPSEMRRKRMISSAKKASKVSIILCHQKKKERESVVLKRHQIHDVKTCLSRRASTTRTAALNKTCAPNVFTCRGYETDYLSSDLLCAAIFVEINASQRQTTCGIRKSSSFLTHLAPPKHNIIKYSISSSAL